MISNKKHSDEEIIKAGGIGIGDLDKGYLNSNDEIRVIISLKHKEDGVLYTYDVFFKKTFHRDRGIVWQFSHFVPVV